MLKEILSSTHWTQEKLAAKLGVSFATVNYWVNGKTKPQKSMMKDIERLYLAQDLTGESEPVYITLISMRSSKTNLRVGDYVLLTKEIDNGYDDESISAELIDQELSANEKGMVVEQADEDPNMTDETSCEIILDEIYVANSVSTVVRGTWSAGRIYDKFSDKARAQVVFTFRNMAIGRVTSWEG